MEIGGIIKQGLRVRAILKEKGLSAMQLHRKTGIDDARIYNILSGKTEMSAGEVTEIAKALNVEYEQILDEYKI